MRRFWAHITLALTALIVMSTTFFSIFTKLSFNQQYTEGSEITYRLTNKEDETIEIEDPDAAKNIAELMKNRLDILGITEYNVKTVSNDIIKVQFAEPNNLNKSNIVSYLGFNGSLALSNMDDDENYLHITAAEFRDSSKPAYLDSINSYPTIVIPVLKDSPAFQDLLSKTNTQKDSGIGEQTQSQTETDEDGNAKTVTTTYMYLWYDFDEENDRYSKTVEGSEDYDVNVANKIIMKFNIESAYYPDGEDNKLAASLNMDTDNSNSITTTEVRNSYNNARFYVNLLNSEVLDYKVKQINSQQVKFIPATLESLVTNADPHQYVAASSTFIATLVAILLGCLILVTFFRLSAVSIAVSTLFSLYAGIGIIVLMNAEFNIAAVIALIGIALVSLASGIYYASKFKDECYRGRNIKKANSEAARKTTLPIVDMHLALVIIGAFVYLFGGSLMRTFALVSVVGGIASLLVNLIILRLLMFLATNNVAFANKLAIFGVKEDKLPTLTEDGQAKTEVFKGEYEDVNFNKNHKKFGLVTLVLLVASLAGLITFGIIGNNNPLATSTDAEVSTIYVYSKNELLTIDSLTNDVLNKVNIYTDDTNTKTLASYVNKSYNYSSSEIVGGVEQTTYYFEFDLKSLLNENSSADATYGSGTTKTNLKDVLAAYKEVDSKTEVMVKVSSFYGRSQANFGGIVAGTSIALAVIGLYFILRYKLSRGLASLIFALGFTAIGFGIFSLTRIAFPTFSSAIIPLISLFAIIITIIFMSREKEIIVEDKAKEIGFDRRGEMMQKATSTGMNEVLVFSMISAFIAINMFGLGPNKSALTFVLFAIAIILLTVFITNLFGPFSQILYQFLSPVENRRKKKARKKAGKVQSATHRSREPEEAVFIGIND